MRIWGISEENGRHFWQLGKVGDIENNIPYFSPFFPSPLSVSAKIICYLNLSHIWTSEKIKGCTGNRGRGKKRRPFKNPRFSTPSCVMCPLLIVRSRPAVSLRFFCDFRVLLLVLSWSWFFCGFPVFCACGFCDFCWGVLRSENMSAFLAFRVLRRDSTGVLRRRKKRNKGKGKKKKERGRQRRKEKK